MSLLRRQCAAQEEFLKGKRDELRVKVKLYREVRHSMYFDFIVEKLTQRNRGVRS
jgi:hypothetical protein